MACWRVRTSVGPVSVAMSGGGRRASPRMRFISRAMRAESAAAALSARAVESARLRGTGCCARTTATVANITAALVATAIYNAEHTTLAGVLALVTLPLVARAFGVIASGFGVMVVRGDDAHSPVAALWRGHVTTAVIALGGLAGATLWLLGEHFWFPFFAAGALGVGGGQEGGPRGPRGSPRPRQQAATTRHGSQ